MSSIVPHRRVREKDVQRSILDYLALRRIFHWRNNSGALVTETKHLVRFGAPGSPDIFAVVEGRCIGIEVKGTGGRQSALQKDFQKRFVLAGGIYILADSLNDIIGNPYIY